MNTYLSAVLEWFGTAQFLAVLLMLRAVFPLKCSRKRSALLILGVTLAFALTNGLFATLSGRGVISGRSAFIAFTTLNLCFNRLYGQMAFQADWRQQTSTILFFNGFLLITLLITRTIVDPLAPSIDLGEALAFPVLALETLALKRITRPIEVRLSKVFWCLVNLTPLLLIMLVTVWAGEKQGDGFLLTGGCLFVMQFTIYYLLNRMNQEMEAQTLLAIDNQNLVFQLRQMDNIKIMLENTRKLRHEQKSYFFAIESLVREGKTAEALDYIHQEINPAFDKAELISTGNRFVDMVLSQKVAEARLQGIPTVLNVLLPPSIPMNPQMLCSILFNLWDNAIEASSRVEHPDIRFSMRETKGYISIAIRNNIDCSVLEVNPKLNTTKQDSKNHGIGMSMIRKVVEQNSGDLRIYEEDGAFVVDVLLMLNEPQQ